MSLRARWPMKSENTAAALAGDDILVLAHFRVDHQAVNKLLRLQRDASEKAKLGHLGNDIPPMAEPSDRKPRHQTGQPYQAPEKMAGAKDAPLSRSNSPRSIRPTSCYNDNR